LSRVQRQNIQLVPLGKIVARLREIAQAEDFRISDGAVTMVARQAQGSMRDALSLLDQLFSAHDPAAEEIGDEEAAQTLGALDTSVVRDIVTAVLARDASAAMGGVVRAYEQGADMKRLAEELASQARNLALASLPGVKQDLPDHEVRSLAQEAAQHDSAQLARVFELLQLAQDEVAKASSPRHALEVALLRAVRLAPASSSPELVAKLDALGRGAPACRSLSARARGRRRSCWRRAPRWRPRLRKRWGSAPRCRSSSRKLRRTPPSPSRSRSCGWRHPKAGSRSPASTRQSAPRSRSSAARSRTSAIWERSREHARIRLERAPPAGATAPGADSRGAGSPGPEDRHRLEWRRHGDRHRQRQGRD